MKFIENLKHVECVLLLLLFIRFNQKLFSDEKPKPPTEPAALVPKDSNSVAEDDAPWRRSGSLRTRAQQESPPKTRKFSFL